MTTAKLLNVEPLLIYMNTVLNEYTLFYSVLRHTPTAIS